MPEPAFMARVWIWPMGWGLNTPGLSVWFRAGGGGGKRGAVPSIWSADQKLLAGRHRLSFFRKRLWITPVLKDNRRQEQHHPLLLWAKCAYLGCGKPRSNSISASGVLDPLFLAPWRVSYPQVVSYLWPVWVGITFYHPGWSCSTMQRIIQDALGERGNRTWFPSAYGSYLMCGSPGFLFPNCLWILHKVAIRYMHKQFSGQKLECRTLLCPRRIL